MLNILRKLVLAVCCICLFGCTGQKPQSETYTELSVSILNIGKADCIVLQSGELTMMVDTGYEETSDIVLDYLKDQGIDQIDYLVITHYDKDHVGGAVDVLENVEVGYVYIPSYEGTSKKYTKFMEAIDKEGILYTKVTKDMKVSLNDVDITIMSTMLTFDGTNDNDMSLVLSVEHGENSLLLAGDAEKDRIKELLTKINHSYNFYKVPHHGKIEKNSESLISLISPEYAMITCSVEEMPDEELLDILKAHNVTTFLSVDSGIQITSDGIHEIEIQEIR